MIVLLSDSKATLEAIVSQSDSHSSTLDFYFNLLNWLTGNGKEVALQWIPAQWGSETADYLPKKRSLNPPNITFWSLLRLHQVNC
ncbi:hypothetical protein TNIN_283281 [Trichonephila inaurata madagascariensis]|uniref:Uncharacterized protein n=1 Tax=Trichonephila inaurata madagascariensis TaxID=2747483 RepID=A0A8X6XA87_9ARAC|nr:hypothetical protein TNIN_283281 [Trichonephila inaurata madagascariensis]